MYRFAFLLHYLTTACVGCTLSVCIIFISTIFEMHFQHWFDVWTALIRRPVSVYTVIWTILRNQYKLLKSSASSQSIPLQSCRPVRPGSHNASIVPVVQNGLTVAGEAICKLIYLGSALVAQLFQVGRPTCTLGGRLSVCPSTASRAGRRHQDRGQQSTTGREAHRRQRPSRTAGLCPRRNSGRAHEKAPSRTLVCMFVQLLILGPAQCGLRNVCRARRSRIG